MSALPALTLVERACPICGPGREARVFAEARFSPERLDAASFSSRKSPERMHFRLLRCGGCGVLYASPAPPPDELARLYAGASFEATEESRFAARTYVRLVRAAGVPPTARILDIGAGDGAFLAALEDAGYAAGRGIEPSRAPFEKAPAAVRARLSNVPFEEARFAEGSFDLVTLFQTVEHVSDPLGLAARVRLWLRPGGSFFVICHDEGALSARLLGTRSPIFDVEHLQLFSRGSVRALLERAGFTVEAVRPFWNVYPARYWARLFPAPAPLGRAALGALDATGLGRIPVPLPAGNLSVWARR